MKDKYISSEGFPCRGEQSKHLAPWLNMEDLVQGELPFLMLLVSALKGGKSSSIKFPGIEEAYIT